MAYLNSDVPELFGSDTSLCLTNLDILEARRDRITESMLAILSELADAILQDSSYDPDTVDSILLSLHGAAEESDDGAADVGRTESQVAPVNREWVGRISRLSGIHMRLILYRLIGERLAAHPSGIEGSSRTGKPHASSDAARGRIAYMAGAFADKAYERLSASVPRARAATFHSFVDACEEVRGGLCEYCILPLENSQSGKLIAFSRLILRYGLYIVAVCDLENGALPGQSTRFGLLRRMNEGDGKTPAPAGAPLYLELLHTTGSASLGDFLSAAAFCALRPLRMDTLPHFEELQFLLHEGTDDRALPICCVLDASDADLDTFRHFLALETPENILMGLYTTV